MAEREWHEVAGESAMQSWRIPVIRYRGSSGRPGAYLQAALHADEQPGVAVTHELAKLLDGAEADRRLLRDVVLVPNANPIGLHQVVDGRLMGRFHLGSGTNFNRAFELPQAGRNSPETSSQRADERLKAILTGLAEGCDVILDLHCDKEAELYMYCHAELWPSATDMAARLGVAAVLLWAGAEEGGAAFEEAVTIGRLPATAAKPFLSATLELRGQADVTPDLAQRDARGLYELLADRGMLADPAVAARPSWNGPAVRQNQVVNVAAPALGPLFFEAAVGARVRQGQCLARILAVPGDAASEIAVPAPADGLLLIRGRDRLAQPGETIATIITDRPDPGSVAGRMLSN